MIKKTLMAGAMLAAFLLARKRRRLTRVRTTWLKTPEPLVPTEPS